MDETFVVKGTVTNVDPILLCFDVTPDLEDNIQFGASTVTVHAVLLFIDNEEQKLPAISTKVLLKSKYFKCEEFHCFVVLTNHEDFTEVPTNDIFVTVAKNLNLSPSDLLLVASNYNKLKKNLTLKDTDLILGALQSLGHCNFEFQFLSQLKHVDHEADTYKDFGYWTFGTHWNWSDRVKPKYLFGYFLCGKCTIHFTDGVREVPCIFTNNENNEIGHFFNYYVLIKDYTFVSELYNSLKFCAMEYLIVDVNEVVNLKMKQNNRQLWIETPPGTPSKFTCRIVSKSQKMALSVNSFGYWLQVKSDNTKDLLFRVRTVPEHDVFPFLQVGHVYNVFCEKQPPKIWDSEVEKLRKFGNSLKSVLCYELPLETHFAPASSGNGTLEIVDVSGALTRLQDSVNLVSFQGVILMKVFTKPMSSRTAPVTSELSFGTPGVKTHKLVFDCQGKHLELYLNNWENLAAPLGLIPNMRVIIRNVLPQKRKYYKSTILTSIEVVSYEPELRFETANLCDRTWGVPCFLGFGKLIPTSTVIWGRILSFSIQSLKFEMRNNDVTGVITLAASDNIGESKIIAKEAAALLLLRLLLQLGEAPFEEWMEGFVALGSYTYSKEKSEDLAKTLLHEYFKEVESKSFSLELKCRKMDNEASGRPVFFLLDAR